MRIMSNPIINTVVWAVMPLVLRYKEHNTVFIGIEEVSGVKLVPIIGKFAFSVILRTHTTVKVGNAQSVTIKDNAQHARNGNGLFGHRRYHVDSACIAKAVTCAATLPIRDTINSIGQRNALGFELSNTIIQIYFGGVDEFGNTFLCHPDTGVPIPGMVMPDWDKAIAMIEEMMHVYPDIRFVGWDIAYTDQGWIVIEANDNGQFHGAQIPHHRGFMDQVKEYMAEL